MDIIAFGHNLDSAPHLDIEFLDFQCAHCLCQLENGTDPPIPCISIAPTAVRAGLSSAPPASLLNAFARGFSRM